MTIVKLIASVIVLISSNHYESVVYLSTICLFAPCYTISKPQSDWMPSLDKEDGVKVVVDKEDNYRS
jgi:hypothetical protein